MVHVPGWAFATPEVRTKFIEDFQKALEILGIERCEVNERGGLALSRELQALLRDIRTDRRHGYNQFSVVLQHPQISHLSARQKVLIADDGNACFGGRIEGNRVVVYTD